MSSLIESDEYDIRYTLPEDEAPLKEMLSEPEINKWMPIDQEKGVELFSKNWIFFSKYKCALTCVYQGNPIAMGILFLMPYKKVAHLSMLYFVVSSKFQGHGIGSSLVKNLKHLAKDYLKLESIHIEVYEGCPGIPILLDQGFTEIIRQEKFVRLEGEYLARMVYEVQL